jgi:HEAT repeat protein
MRGALRATQLRVMDAGLLPESEMVRRAAENNLTIYEMVRDPKLYDLPALLDAADLALERNPDNLPQLVQLLESPDSGLRYWGITGCFLLESKPAQIAALLKDPSHEVRLMAAWLLIRTGEEEQGFQALEGVLRENGYAMLTAMNLIDWIGEEAKLLLKCIPEEAALGNYEKRMLGVLKTRFNETMEE